MNSNEFDVPSTNFGNFDPQSLTQVAFQISEANPIQKRQKLIPLSIFPMQSLPKFNYSSNSSESTTINDTINSSQKLMLPSTSFKEIFKNCLYIFNPRVQMKNNAEFGCLKVQYVQSGVHKAKFGPQTIQQCQKQMKSQNLSKLDKVWFSVPNQNENLEIDTVEKQEIYFESRFESGNLCCVSAVQDSIQPAYYLTCTRDMNTTKCTQWFFFQTINKKPGKVTFHILNFLKKSSIFQNGMKICVASKSNDYKWIRAGTDIRYRESNIPISTKRADKFYYALSFSFNYTQAEDCVYFAYCYPYTYTMLEDFLFSRTLSSSYLKRRNIATTPGGNSVDLITITNFKQKQARKRTIFITARVHPGETPSSFVCEGMMKYLLGETEEARLLRDHFIFKFVPMLNPDGVINGAYRCSLSGYDLNRVWHRADKFSHPEIYGASKAIFQTSETQKIFLYADLHAHSKKKGVFVYGCQNNLNPYLCRQIPFLFWRNVHQFSYHQCNFMMRTGREGTSRLYIYRQLQVDYSYTIQHSFCGSSRDRVHYNPQDYIKIGVEYLLTFFKYFCQHKKALGEIGIFDELLKSKQLLKVGEGQDASSSDEELDKQKAPLPLNEKANRTERKILVRKPSFKVNESFQNPKKISNFRRTNINLSESKSKEYISSRPLKEGLDFTETLRQLPLVGPNFRDNKLEKEEQYSGYISYQPRVCSSSLTNHGQQEEKKHHMRETYRYDQEEQINSLTNLFLPSLTRVSYKKYSRKSSSPKNMVQVGTNFLEGTLLMKEEIRSIQKKKPNWKDQARSYF